MTKTEQTVSDFIARHAMLKPSQQVLVALSGGADSVCLLLMLHSMGYECSAAHCNFHLRGEESNRDEQFVVSLCKRLDVSLYNTSFDTKEYAHTHSQSIEMAARELRYHFFADILRDTNIPSLAVGHHQDDDVETVILNMVRGTGIRGVSGIQPVRQQGATNIVRPLICLTHSDIIEYLHSKGESWVEDSTNQQDDVARNIVRLNVIPQLKRISQGAVENMASTIRNLSEVERVYQHAIAKDIATCLDEQGNMDIASLMQTVSPQSVLHEWLKGRGFNSTHESDILAAIRSGQSGKVINGLLIDRTSLMLECMQQFPSPADITIKVFPREEVTISPDSHFAYLDADKLQGELTIRTVKQGDAFCPFGMKGKCRLLSDFMTDRKLNLFQKQHQLVLTDASGAIAWVVGLRSSECFRVDENTTRVVVCELHD